MSVCLTTACGTGGWVGPLPGDPDNIVTLTAVPAFGGIDIRYVGPGLNPHAVSFAILWRGTSLDFNLAVEIDRFSGSHYYDKVDSSTTYYYWIQLVSIHGTVNGAVGPVSATARPLINDLLTQLSGKIEAGALSTALNTKLGEIDLLGTNLASEITARQNGETTLAQAIANAQAGADQALTFISQEIADRASADQALAGQIDTVAVALDGDIAAVQQSMSAEVTRIDGELTNIGARWTVNLTANNLVGGFGVYNDGTTVEAGFDVDLFWVGKTALDKVKPFVIDQGEVFIDQAVINQITFTKLRDEQGAVMIENGKIKGDYLNVTQLNVQSAASGQRTVITNSLIQVFDANNVERVRLGVW